MGLWPRRHALSSSQQDQAGDLSSKKEAYYTLEDDETLARDFVADADNAALSQDPARARLSIRVILLVAAAFLLWATFSHVDELTKGEGRVVPSRQLQVLQSLDGGMISEILVKEGQQVEEGQTLLRIDPTRFMSGFGENQASLQSLQIRAARLSAISTGKAFIVPAELREKAPLVASQEETLYNSSMAELSGQIGIARDQMRQRSEELSEARARLAAAEDALALSQKELNLTRPLVASGAVSDVDLLRLERDVARNSGDKSQASAQIARLRAAIGEAQTKIANVELEFKNKARSELSEVQAKLDSLKAGSVALSDKVKQADLKSPVNGIVKRLLYNTVGGVVQPGKDIVEIVPLEDNLLLEAKVAPRDIAFLRPGQPAKVKLTAYDFAIYGALDGELEQIGADSLTDDKGRSYYIVRVRTRQSSLGENLPIIPGMMAEVDILTGKKTVLSYLMKPVLRAKQYALTER
jgi:adhesin transport system membrane fusion protein